VVALNRAVAIAKTEGPGAALALLHDLVAEPALRGTHRVWAVRADLYRRLGEYGQALDEYDRALELVDNTVERSHLRDMRRTYLTAAS
jgi:predicted RNA polymerase sigma factor